MEQRVAQEWSAGGNESVGSCRVKSCMTGRRLWLKPLRRFSLLMLLLGAVQIRMLCW